METRNFYEIDGLIEYGIKLGYEASSNDEADFASGKKNFPLQIAAQTAAQKEPLLMNVANVATDGKSVHFIEKKGILMLPCVKMQLDEMTNGLLKEFEDEVRKLLKETKAEERGSQAIRDLINQLAIKHDVKGKMKLALGTPEECAARAAKERKAANEFNPRGTMDTYKRTDMPPAIEETVWKTAAKEYNEETTFTIDTKYSTVINRENAAKRQTASGGVFAPRDETLNNNPVSVKVDTNEYNKNMWTIHVATYDANLRPNFERWKKDGCKKAKGEKDKTNCLVSVEDLQRKESYDVTILPLQKEVEKDGVIVQETTGFVMKQALTKINVEHGNEIKELSSRTGSDPVIIRELVDNMPSFLKLMDTAQARKGSAAHLNLGFGANARHAEEEKAAPVAAVEMRL